MIYLIAMTVLYDVVIVVIRTFLEQASWSTKTKELYNGLRVSR
jgi:hypothetical protein